MHENESRLGWFAIFNTILINFLVLMSSVILEIWLAFYGF